MSWENNFYYYPEKSGLKVIGSVNDPDASYSFDDLVAWQHEDGSIYWEQDSGCSCPMPFERFESLENLNKIASRQDFMDFIKAVLDHCVPYNYETSEYEYDKDPEAADKAELISKVSTLLYESEDRHLYY